MDNFGYLDQSGMGVYSYGTQFELDPYKLKTLGFTQEEIDTVNYIVSYFGKVTVANMVQNFGISYEQAQRLKYMYDICTGRVVIDSTDDLAKHLRRMFGKHRRIGINDLDTSKIGEVPRKVLIGGIPETTPDGVWNSNKYKGIDCMYDAINITGGTVVIRTNRIPKLPYKYPKKLDGILEIMSDPKDGIMEVAINKKYCRLCNRFVIAASLRKPEFHLGLVEIICIEGTRVYVFADEIKGKTYTRYGSTSQRVYDYGFTPGEIKPKLLNSATLVYRKLCGVTAFQHPANVAFSVMPEEPVIQEELAVE